MRLCLIFFLVTFCAIDAYAQQEYLIYFRDKGDASFTDQWKAQQLVSPRCYKRRGGVQNDWYDLPVSETYLNQLAIHGQIKTVSKWLNACVLESNQPPPSLPFIATCKHIARNGQSGMPKSEIINGDNKKFMPESSLGKQIRYGAMAYVNALLGIQCIHAAGFTGKNILVTFLDAGYKALDTISLFSDFFHSSRIVYKYNLWDNDTNIFVKTSHGMSCLALLAANAADAYVGTAPDVDVALIVAEDYSTETHRDEVLYVRGLEIADSLGADIVSASLAYFTFDAGEDSYTFSDMDGNTAISTIGVDIASSKGLLVVGSAGNKGGICAPCDADQILCVGGVDLNGKYDSFSSVGLSFDGRIKPDVASFTRDIPGVFGDGQIDWMDYGGTSSATPQIAGMAACLMQAHPLASNMQIRDAIIQSGRSYDAPTKFIGHGIPDACRADSILRGLIVVSKHVNTNKSIILFPNPASDEIVIRSPEIPIQQCTIYRTDGKMMASYAHIELSQFRIPVSELKSGLYILNLVFDNGAIEHRRFFVTH